MPILRSIQCVTLKYGDFQKALRISLREPSISINSIMGTDDLLFACSFVIDSGNQERPLGEGKILNIFRGRK